MVFTPTNTNTLGDPTLQCALHLCSALPVRGLEETVETLALRRCTARPRDGTGRAAGKTYDSWEVTSLPAVSGWLKSAAGDLFISLLRGDQEYFTMPKLAPTLKLNSGADFPVIGLGTWKSPPGQVEQAVKDAIDAGYRHIDGAFVYGNETEVGAGIRAKIAEGVIKREDIFVTSKLWNTFHRPDLVENHCRTSLQRLGLEYLDLYLIHWPTGYEEGGELFPRNQDGTVRYSDVDFVDTWKAMEECVRLGLVRSIGLSNFNSEQIERVMQNSSIKPAVLQIECHAYLNQKKLIEFCKARNLTVTAYSPLGSPDRPWAKPDDPQLLEDPKIKAMAAKYKKSPAQVVLRYLIQNGVVPIPKSVTKHRIIENFQVFDFELSPEDVQTMDTFDCNGRICPLNDGVRHKYYPFKIPF